MDGEGYTNDDGGYESGTNGGRAFVACNLTAGRLMAAEQAAAQAAAAANEPTPPGYNPSDWTWEPPTGKETTGPWRHFDPSGGEWRYHPTDPYHPVPHFDYNPWDNWNSPWQNVYPWGPHPKVPPGMY